VFGCERCIPTQLIEGQFEVSFTSEAVLVLLPVIGASEPLTANSLPSDGGLEQVDV
tara:strand:+ start:30 stop:197 length:168 start_codon:yes stop_codon:yes gene_type:complete